MNYVRWYFSDRTGKAVSLTRGDEGTLNAPIGAHNLMAESEHLHPVPAPGQSPPDGAQRAVLRACASDGHEGPLHCGSAPRPFLRGIARLRCLVGADPF